MLHRVYHRLQESVVSSIGSFLINMPNIIIIYSPIKSHKKYPQLHLSVIQPNGADKAIIMENLAPV